MAPFNILYVDLILFLPDRARRSHRPANRSSDRRGSVVLPGSRKLRPHSGGRAGRRGGPSSAAHDPTRRGPCEQGSCFQNTEGKHTHTHTRAVITKSTFENPRVKIKKSLKDCCMHLTWTVEMNNVDNRVVIDRQTHTHTNTSTVTLLHMHAEG